MICLFGGTFDPVHLGHLHAATRVREALGAESVRMLLAARPGHRETPGASAEHRWAMLKLACRDQPWLRPDAAELRRAERLGRPSYTVETLEALRLDEPDAVVNWVIGSDAYREIHTWHRWREVFELCNLVVLRRPGAALDLDPTLAALTRERRLAGPPQAPAGAVVVLDAAMLDVSATQVRKALAEAENASAVADLLPPGVYTYILRSITCTECLVTSESLRNLIVDALEDRKGRDVVALDVSGVSDVTDYMIVASGSSNRHVKALVDRVVEATTSAGFKPQGVEGRETHEWVLVDVGDALVHVMQSEARDFYDLERLWTELPVDSGRPAFALGEAGATESSV